MNGLDELDKLKRLVRLNQGTGTIRTQGATRVNQIKTALDKVKQLE